MGQRQSYLKSNLINHNYNCIDMIVVSIVLSSFATLFMILA